MLLCKREVEKPGSHNNLEFDQTTWQAEAEKGAKTSKPSVQQEGKEGVSLWGTDLRLKTKHPQRIQARPGTITERGSSEGPEQGMGTTLKRPRAYLEQELICT